MNQDDKTDQVIMDDDSQNTRESNLLSEIKEDYLDLPQEVLHPG
jgi:hypothetical protein